MSTALVVCPACAGTGYGKQTPVCDVCLGWLHIEVADITASDAGIVAKALLDTFRELVKAGYDELIQDAGGLHSGALGEVPDEDGVDTYTEPAQLPAKRVGFTTG